MACYDGPNPVKDEERIAIWKWAKENGIDHGMPIDKVGDKINNYFFGGHAKPEWINDILSGRKTAFRPLANEAWRKQYNRRAIVQQAQDISRMASMGPVGKTLRALWSLPRSVQVFGHGIVFPITHAGDLALRPGSWGTFFKGVLRTYRGSFNSAYTGRIMNMISRDPLYDLALRSGVDVGPKSHPSGLISRTYHGPAARAWDMLTVMRFELWKRQASKYLEPGMSVAEQLDIGKNLGEWANHATGSAKGPISDLGGTLFGPKLTQSKISRLTSDPYKAIKTFADWKNATPGEKAVAWTRLSGATQYLVTLTGFMAVNQGLLMALGQKDKVNLTDPSKNDWFAFKGDSVTGYIPGLHTEIKTLAKILALHWATKKELRGDTKFTAAAKILGYYGMGKFTPTIQRGLEAELGQNREGRPLPWSSDKGTPKAPQMSYGEYAGSIGPIPLEGPIAYVYDHLRQSGASSLDAHAITKGLIISGINLTGTHVHEEKPPTQLSR